MKQPDKITLTEGQKVKTEPNGKDWTVHVVDDDCVQLVRDDPKDPRYADAITITKEEKKK